MLKEVKVRTLEAFDNQDYQFEDLVEKVSDKRDTSHHPLFDVMFNFLNFDMDRGEPLNPIPAEPAPEPGPKNPSRVDTAVDKALDKIGNTDLQGKIAIANAKVAYTEFKTIFSGSRWQQLVDKGARVQRVLWASTGTKNPNYSDTLYVDELIGPNTVNTLPPATLESFTDHGKIAETLTKELGEARQQLAKLAELGINLNTVTEKLQQDGVVAFAEPFEALMKSIAAKREKLLAA